MQVNTLPALPCLLLALGAISTARAESQAITEFRDPLRGVTFYSAQISSDSLAELQVDGSRFSSGDRMTVGISAFFFDESDTVDEYVLWLRHEGPRRWFTGPDGGLLRIILDDVSSEPAPLHIMWPSGAPDAGPFVEKLEFALSPPQIRAMVDADVAVLELTTLNGLVEKRLGQQERDAIKRFADGVRLRHDEIKSGFASLQRGASGELPKTAGYVPCSVNHHRRESGNQPA